MYNDNFSNDELENFFKIVGNNVKTYRKSKGMTQEELSLSMGHSSVGHISKCELYKYGKKFNLEQLFLIAKILDCSVEDLVREPK